MQRAELGRRAGQRIAAELGQPGLDRRIGERGVDRRVALASNPGMVSATVGTSGRAALRLRVVTASARSSPALMKPIDAGRLSNITWTWPEIRSVSAGAEPL